MGAGLGDEEVAGGGVRDDAHLGVERPAQDGVGEDDVGRAGGDDGAVDADDLGEVGGEGVELVGGDDDGGAALIKVGEVVEDVVAGLDVHAGGGLVEDEQGGGADQGAGEDDAVLLAAGEVADAALGEAGHAELVEDGGEAVALFPRGPGGAAETGGEAHEDDVLDGDGE